MSVLSTPMSLAAENQQRSSHPPGMQSINPGAGLLLYGKHGKHAAARRGRPRTPQCAIVRYGPRVKAGGKACLLCPLGPLILSAPPPHQPRCTHHFTVGREQTVARVQAGRGDLLQHRLARGDHGTAAVVAEGAGGCCLAARRLAVPDPCKTPCQHWGQPMGSPGGAMPS